MRMALALMVLMMAGVAAGCSDAAPASTVPGPDGSVAAATTSTKAPAFSNAQLATALLTTSDIGGTWKVSAKDSASPTPSPTPPKAATPTSDTGCAYFDRWVKNQENNDLLWGDGPHVSFTVDTFGPFLTHHVNAPGESEAKKTLSMLSSLASNCKTFQSVDENGTTTEFKIERIELKKAADDTVGLRLMATTPPTLLGAFAVELSMIAVRKGPLISVVSWVGINTKPDPAFLQRLTDAAGEKLKTVK